MWKTQSSKQLQYPVSPGAGQVHLPLQHLHPEAKEETLAVDQKREKEREKVDERAHLQSLLPGREAGRIHNPLLTIHTLERWQLSARNIHPQMSRIAERKCPRSSKIITRNRAKRWYTSAEHSRKEESVSLKRQTVGVPTPTGPRTRWKRTMQN